MLQLNVPSLITQLSPWFPPKLGQLIWCKSPFVSQNIQRGFCCEKQFSEKMSQAGEPPPLLSLSLSLVIDDDEFLLVLFSSLFAFNSTVRRVPTHIPLSRVLERLMKVDKYSPHLKRNCQLRYPKQGSLIEIQLLLYVWNWKKTAFKENSSFQRCYISY